MKKETPDQPIANSIEILLRNQRKGRMLTELSEQMQAVANAAREHGKSAVPVIRWLGQRIQLVHALKP